MRGEENKKKNPQMLNIENIYIYIQKQIKNDFKKTLVKSTTYRNKCV